MSPGCFFLEQENGLFLEIDLNGLFLEQEKGFFLEQENGLFLEIDLHSVFLEHERGFFLEQENGFFLEQENAGVSQTVSQTVACSTMILEQGNGCVCQTVT